MSNVAKPPYDASPERAEIREHAWWPHQDMASQTTIWRCTCGEQVFQPFETPVPDEIIGHPQSHGLLRGGEVKDPRR